MGVAGIDPLGPARGAKGGSQSGGGFGFDGDGRDSGSYGLGGSGNGGGAGGKSLACGSSLVYFIVS